MRMNALGHENLRNSSEWPKKENLQGMPVGRQKLNRIGVAVYSDMYLFGIQLGFTNGRQSPYFHTKSVNDENELKWTEIDTSKTIRKVSVYLTRKIFI